MTVPTAEDDARRLEAVEAYMRENGTTDVPGLVTIKKVARPCGDGPAKRVQAQLHARYGDSAAPESPAEQTGLLRPVPTAATDTATDGAVPIATDHRDRATDGPAWPGDTGATAGASASRYEGDTHRDNGAMRTTMPVAMPVAMPGDNGATGAHAAGATDHRDGATAQLTDAMATNGHGATAHAMASRHDRDTGAMPIATDGATRGRHEGDTHRDNGAMDVDGQPRQRTTAGATDTATEVRQTSDTHRDNGGRQVRNAVGGLAAAALTRARQRVENPTERPASRRTAGRLTRWHIAAAIVIALPAFLAVWSGWIGLGELTGWGERNMLPGVVEPGGWATVNTSLFLPIGIETFAALALAVWFATRGSGDRAVVWFSGVCAFGGLALGAFGQVCYHVLSSAGDAAPSWLTAFVAVLPVMVLGASAALLHLAFARREADDAA